MKILVTNDDGYFSQGIKALALALSKRHEVVLLAPKFNRSAVGHGLTLRDPLQPENVGDEFPFLKEAYCLKGTPVDCVRLAFAARKTRPDCVISGINKAGNIGTDVLYSGTVSAAEEAAMLGCRAVAVSKDVYSDEHFTDAAEHFAENLPLFLGCMTAEKRLLNVNYPDLPREKYRGIRAAYLAEQVYTNEYRRVILEDGSEAFVDCSKKVTVCAENDTSDEKLIRDGFITVTPIRYDVTDYEQLARITAAVERDY